MTEHASAVVLTRRGRPSSPLGAPPHALIGTTKFSKKAGNVPRSVSSERPVFRIVTGAGEGTEKGATRPHEVSVQSLVPTFTPNQPGVYTEVVTMSRTGSAAAIKRTDDERGEELGGWDGGEGVPKANPPPQAACALPAAPPAYSTIVKSIVRAKGLEVPNSRRPSSANWQPTRDQLAAMRPATTAATIKRSVSPLAAPPSHGLRKSSVDPPRVAAPPMDPSKQPRTYRRSVSAEAVPHRAASADYHRQHQAVGAARPQPTSRRASLQPPPAHPAKDASPAHPATGRLDYSDNAGAPLAAQGRPLSELVVPELTVTHSSDIRDGNDTSSNNDSSSSDSSGANPSPQIEGVIEAPQAALPKGEMQSEAVVTSAPKPIHITLALRQRTSFNHRLIEANQSAAVREMVLRQGNIADVVSFLHHPDGVHRKPSPQQPQPHCAAALRLSRSPSSQRGVAVAALTSRSVSPEIDLRGVYTGGSHGTQLASSSSHRSASREAITSKPVSTRLEEIESRLHKFSLQRQQSKQGHVPVYHYTKPSEVMKCESQRRSQRLRDDDASLIVDSPSPKNGSPANKKDDHIGPSSNSVTTASPVRLKQGLPASSLSPPGKLLPLTTPKELSHNAFEQSLSPKRRQEAKKAEQKATFKKLLQLGLSEDSKRLEPKWAKSASSLFIDPSSTDRMSLSASSATRRYHDPFERDTTTTSPLLSRSATEQRPRSPKSPRTPHTQGGGFAHGDVFPPQPAISPDTLRQFEAKASARAEADRAKDEERNAAIQRQEAVRVAYKRMKSPMPIPEQVPVVTRKK